MKKLKKILSLVLAAAMIMGILTACRNKADETKTSETNRTNETNAASGETSNSGNASGAGKVYYMNFKPEVDAVWQKIASQYTKETGVPVKVVTAASGTYEQTLKAEIAKSDAPTAFHINGPIGYQSWKDYCLDISDTELVSWVNDPAMLLQDNGKTYATAITVEGYGIIYNNAIMEKYFALEGSVVSSMDEINNFSTLKAVVEDMTANKDALGIEGVFASTSLTPGEDWRWQTHLANIPLFYEFKDHGVNDLQEIQFTYSDNFKNIFDLYIDYSTTEPSLLGSKTVTDSMSEFALGKAAMVQNGNWAWSQVADVEGNVVEKDDIKFLPVYTGMKGEENQGLCIGTENFLAFNSESSPEDQKATLDFFQWVFRSDEGKKLVVNDLGYIAPFNTFGEDEKPSDPLSLEVLRYMGNENLSTVTWNFVAFPGQTFKDDFGAALLDYCNGNMTWDEVKEQVIEDWAYEKGELAQ